MVLSIDMSSCPKNLKIGPNEDNIEGTVIKTRYLNHQRIHTSIKIFTAGTSHVSTATGHIRKL